MEVRLLKDVLRQMTGLLYRQRLQLEALQRSSGDTAGPSTPRMTQPRPWPPPQQPTTSSPAPGVPVGWSVDEGLLRSGGGGGGQWAEHNAPTNAPSLPGDFLGGQSLFFAGSTGDERDDGYGPAAGGLRPPAVRPREEQATSVSRHNKSQRRDTLLSLFNQIPSCTASCPVPFTADHSRSSQAPGAVMASGQSCVPVEHAKAKQNANGGDRGGGNGRNMGGSEECDQRSGGGEGTTSSDLAGPGLPE